jgi:hypothetical protein
MPRYFTTKLAALMLGASMAFVAPADAEDVPHGCITVEKLVERGQENNLRSVFINDDRRLEIFDLVGTFAPSEVANFTPDQNAIVFYSTQPGTVLLFNEKDGVACRYLRVSGPYAYAIYNIAHSDKPVKPTGLGI